MGDFEDTYVQLSTLVGKVNVPQLNDYDIRLCANDEGTAWVGFDLWHEETLTSLCWVPFEPNELKNQPPLGGANALDTTKTS